MNGADVGRNPRELHCSRCDDLFRNTTGYSEFESILGAPEKDEETIESFFAELTPFQVVVEATASYEWFVSLVEPLADRVLLAHPKKLRVIAESTRKTDKLDAQILAEFLAQIAIPVSKRVVEISELYRTA